MKIKLPGVSQVFDCGLDKLWTLQIENQKLLYTLLLDIHSQVDGCEGKTVVSLENKILSVKKTVQMVTQYVPFELNQKTLLNRIATEITKVANDEEYYIKSMELAGEIQEYLMELAVRLPGNIGFSNVSIDSLIKTSGVRIDDDTDCLIEKLISYFGLVTAYEGSKLFITVNLRSFIDDYDAEKFMKSVLLHRYQLLMIENCDHEILGYENRYIVDNDLCELM